MSSIMFPGSPGHCLVPVPIESTTIHIATILNLYTYMYMFITELLSYVCT